MPKYWLISDRDGGTSTQRNKDGLTYWVSDTLPLNDINSWKNVSHDEFKTLLAGAADSFAPFPQGENEKQSHVTILIHGFNENFVHSTDFYRDFCGRLFEGPDSMGLCILYDWPSLGSVVGYEPDRASARACAGDLTDILCDLFDWLITKQQALINARCESVREKRSFKSSFQHRRCLVPADGFYEWTKVGKRPHFFTVNGGAPFAIGGIWEPGGDVSRCCLLTTSANAILEPIHNRMPVIVRREAGIRSGSKISTRSKNKGTIRAQGTKM